MELIGPISMLPRVLWLQRHRQRTEQVHGVDFVRTPQPPFFCSCGLDDEVNCLWGWVCCANIDYGRATRFWAHRVHLNCDLPYQRRQVYWWFSKIHQLQKVSPHTYSYHATELSAWLSNHIYKFNFAWLHMTLSCVSNVHNLFHAFHAYYDLFHSMLDPCTNEYSLFFLPELQLYFLQDWLNAHFLMRS